MAAQSNKTLLRLLYPYMFMLKEGPEFKGNPLDYSLLIVQTKSEVLQSPKQVPLPVPETNIENLF